MSNWHRVTEGSPGGPATVVLDVHQRQPPPVTVYDATEILFQHRHDLPSDILRTIQDVWTCASQARFGEPYEAFWEDVEWAGHDVADCEAPPERWGEDHAAVDVVADLLGGTVVTEETP